MTTINIAGKEVDVEQFKNDWALALMSRGIIVRLNVSRWRAKTRLTPEVLGLRFVDEKSFDFAQKYITLGEQKLLPPSVSRNIEVLERRARVVLDEYSFDTVWGKFVPFTAFEEWEKENQKIHDDFMAQAEVIGRDYKSIIELIKNDYRNMARDVWSRLYPKDTGGATTSFVEDFISKIIAKIPSEIEIMGTFKYNVTYFIIPMPSFIEDNIAKAEEIKREVASAQFGHELEMQTKKRIAEEYAKKKQELIDDFLESTVTAMRKYVGELCDTILQSIGQQNTVGKGKLTTKYINKIKGMIQKIKLLNFYDDVEIKDILKDLDIEVSKIKGETDRDIVVNKLKGLVEIGKKEFLPKNFNPAISVLEIK